MTMETDSTVPRRPRWLMPVLIASLAFNALVIGGVAASAWKHGRGHHREGGERGLMGFMRNLPAERQTGLREQLQAAQEAVRTQRQAAKDAWAASNAALTAEPFDKAAFKSAMAKVTEAEGSVRATIVDSFADVAEKLTPEERQKLKEWREHRRPGGGRHWGRRNRDQE